ncbi:MAG: enoyl-CoA hydratase/isomerase family protein [Spirochaetales bacterium]|nr:MAG: enoyl-CoA hydratase/isomerase family protein [Spirochaetales bacterium]
MAYVRCEIREAAGWPVAVITFDKPEELNALSGSGIAALSDLLADLDADISDKPAAAKTPRVLVLTGAGKAFIAGADIREMRKMDRVGAGEFSLAGNRVLRHIENFPVPVIAAVNGYALGGGLEAALAADLICASSRAKFGMPEVTLGIIPGFGGTKRLLRRIGNARTRELVFSGRVIDAEEAFQLGLVNHVFEPDWLMEGVLRMAGEIANASPNALREAKRLIDSCAEDDWDAAMERESGRFAAMFDHPDTAEGLAAFLEKRKPSWR